MIRHYLSAATVLLVLAVSSVDGIAPQPAETPSTVSYLTFSASPFYAQNVFMVPLRDIADWLGAQTAVDKDEIILTRDTTVLHMRLKSAASTLNDAQYRLAAPVIRQADTTYVPLPSICEAFNAGLQWLTDERVFRVSQGEKQAGIVTTCLPVGQRDIVWITSVPSGSKIYDRNGALIGATPMAYRPSSAQTVLLASSPPGFAYSKSSSIGRAIMRYDEGYKTRIREIELEVDLLPEHSKHEVRSYLLPISIIRKIRTCQNAHAQASLGYFEQDNTGMLQAGAPGEAHESFSFSYRAQKKVLPGQYMTGLVESGSDVAISYGAGTTPPKEGLVYPIVTMDRQSLRLNCAFRADHWTRVLKVNRQPGKQSSIILLWQPRNQPLSALISRLPEGANFPFRDAEMSAALAQQGVDRKAMPMLLTILHRGGKVVCTTKRGKRIVEITGENTWRILPAIQ